MTTDHTESAGDRLSRRSPAGALGADGAVPDSGEDLRSVLEYLESGPMADSAWAKEQATQIRAKLGAPDVPAGSVAADAPALEAADEAVPDILEGSPEEAAEAELGEEADDDILHRPSRKAKRRAAAARAAANPAATSATATAATAISATTSDSGDAAATPAATGPAATATGPAAIRPAKRASASPSFVLLVLIVIVGIGFAVWYAGKPAPAASASASASPSQGAAETAQQTAAEAKARTAQLRALLKEKPDDVPSLLELGVLLLNSGDLDGAKAQWDHVLEVDPQQAIAYYNLGFLYLSSDPADTEAAKAAWAKVVELDPDSQMAKTVTTHLQGLLEPASSASSSPAPTSPAPSSVTE